MRVFGLLERLASHLSRVIGPPWDCDRDGHRFYANDPECAGCGVLLWELYPSDADAA